MEAAERSGAEILSLDSMKIYRGLDIGTAKPSAADRARVRHHALDLVDPTEEFNVFRYMAAADAAIAQARARGRRVIVSGGTALYAKALLEGLFEGPPADAALRARWEGLARAEGPERLHGELARRDPAAAAKIHPRDVRRLIRALEVAETTGAPVSARQTQWRGFHGASGPASGRRFRYGFALVRLAWPRAELRRRIARRVERMTAAGLVDEARWVWTRRASLARGPLQAVAYKEFFAFFEGRATAGECAAELVLRTGQLVKAQETWFRKFPGRALPMSDAIDADALLAAWDAAAAEYPEAFRAEMPRERGGGETETASGP